ncbi:MAG: glycosyltransferase family 4 protein [Acidimicrobiales bacterium]
MPGLDLVLVLSERNRGWVLDTICKEIARYHPGRTALHYAARGLPRARAYFFSHYSLFTEHVRRNPSLLLRRTLVWFTHPSDDPATARRVARRLRLASAVVSMSTVHARTLVAQGVPPNKVHVVLSGTDPERFFPHDRDGTGAVGLSSAYYARKEPDRIARLVRLLPGRPFLLVGKGWSEWPGFDRLEAEPNFTYVEPEYDEYPGYYAAMDVFVSPSRLEGGPIPLLEAMMANVVPVCSRTGFGPDLIEHGRNGFLFDVDAPLDEVAALVERAYSLDADVRATVQERTWERVAREIRAVAEAG